MQAYTEIIKSPSDERKYKCIQLENGLRAILVQDDEADMSCAALDVHVGASLDPNNLFGLAHFLEHMLFMGTEKYPSENEYAEYISNNGGYNNAFTSLTDTNYHFEVSNEGFEEAVDRFSQFFLAPLMNESSTEREMKAVDSEYNMSLTNDAWRKFNLIQDLAHKDSQLNRFHCGNLESLKKDGVRESLLEFHRKWYSSNIMNLVLYGKHSLEKLEEWAVTKFSGIENKNVVVPDLSLPKIPFDEENMGQIARFQPIKDKDQIELYWTMPYLRKHYKAGPLSYFSHLIGHEGENSLLSYLKQEDYAMELCAGGDHELDCLSDFCVTITLTKKGLANHEKVVDAVFKYIQRLKELGPQEWVFEENRKIGNLSFQFAEKGQPISTAISLTRNMSHFESPEDLAQVIRQGYTCDEYRPDLLQQVVDVLADPGRCLVLLSSKSFEDSSLPVNHKWYKFNYSHEKISAERILALKNAQAPENSKNLDLPPPNNLIATKFDVIPEDSAMSARPQLVQQWDGVADLWFKKDDKFKKPKGAVACKIYTSDLQFGQVPATSVFVEVWKRIVEEQLREYKYMADCAKLKFNLNILRDNVEFQWFGFDDSLTNYVGETLDKINALKGQECREIFDQVKEQLLQDWKNHYLNAVYQLAYRQLDTQLYDNDREKSHLRAILEEFNYEQFMAMQSQWLKHGRMVWFAHGNFTKEQAKELVDRAVNTLQLQPQAKEHLTPVRVVDLSSQSGGFHRLDFDVPDPTNENSCLLSYYQHGHDRIDDGKVSLLNQLCQQFLNEPTFDQLRTKEQLGYVVFTQQRTARDVYGAWFLIQSPTKNCEYIRKRLDIHMAKMRQKMRDLPDEEFMKITGAVNTSISEKDKNSVEDFMRQWKELATHHYCFDRQEREIAMLKTITKAELQSYFEALFFQEKRANRLDVHWNSSLHQKQAAEPSKDQPAQEEKKEENAAAQGEGQAAQEEAKEQTNGEVQEPEIEPTYETEVRHKNCDSFKRSMGLFVDSYQLNFTTKTFNL